MGSEETVTYLRYCAIWAETLHMAKYGAKSKEEVGKAMHEFKEGKLKSGKSGKKVSNPKQAIAIGLSKARKEGGKVPTKKS